MNKQIVDIIQDCILDVVISPIVENGIFDPSNSSHIIALVERLDNQNISESVINDAVTAIREDGKYPERQAYNKEGWLVTFPSAEYKNIAIQKGTHFSSDPTHGKGGMNLYYKKKGKQKRQTQQNTSSTEPVEPTTTKNIPTQPGEPTSASQTQNTTSDSSKNPTETPSDASSGGQSTLPAAGSVEEPSDNNPKTPPTSDKNQPRSSTEKTVDQQKVSPLTSTPSEPAVPSVESSSLKDKSIEFAKSKGWYPTPYGEWRDKSGESIAVVSLTGEVVPIKSIDREELKIFASKSKS